MILIYIFLYPWQIAQISTGSLICFREHILQDPQTQRAICPRSKLLARDKGPMVSLLEPLHKETKVDKLMGKESNNASKGL